MLTANNLTASGRYAGPALAQRNELVGLQPLLWDPDGGGGEVRERDMGIDYQREKYGTIALANYLVAQGWEEVLLQVRPESLDSTLDGMDVPVIDPVRDATDPKYKYNIYFVLPGRIDLVARRGRELLLVEARGTSVHPGTAVKKVIQRINEHSGLGGKDCSYGILVPDDPAWLAVLDRDRSPVLKLVTVFLVSEAGTVRPWPPRPTGEEGIGGADDADADETRYGSNPA